MRVALLLGRCTGVVVHLDTKVWIHRMCYTEHGTRNNQAGKQTETRWLVGVRLVLCGCHKGKQNLVTHIICSKEGMKAHLEKSHYLPASGGWIEGELRRRRAGVGAALIK